MAAPIVPGFVAWALRPLHSEPIASPSLRPPAAHVEYDSERTSPIDPQTFAVNLWNVPANPLEDIKVAADPPAQPLNVQLIGVITEGSLRKAALYDADHDRLLIVADGQRLRDQVVHVRAEGVVELTDGQTTRRLVLRAEKDGSS